MPQIGLENVLGENYPTWRKDYPTMLTGFFQRENLMFSKDFFWVAKI